MTKGYFEFEYLKRRDLKDEVQKVVQNYFNIYNSVAGTVDYFANLPSASANLNKIWLVRFATTFLGIITKQAGLYISDGTNWNWMTSLEAKADKNILISTGNGLTGGGDLSANRTISHSDTSTQANVVNTNGNVIQSANLDDFGHITSFSSINLDNRYITTSGAYANPTWITSLNANKLTGTIPSNVLSGSTLYIGTTAIELNRPSGNQVLTGFASLQFVGAVSGTATIQAPAVAGTATFALPTTSGNLIGSGDVGSVTNTMLAGSIADSKLNTITTAGKVANSATTATNLNTANAIVNRDASGNFNAGTITGALSGNSTTATTLQTARTINGVSFNGSANITITANTPNALTISSPLTGGSFNGSSAISIGIQTATSLLSGALLNTDWINFNTAYDRSPTALSVTGTTTKTITLTKQDGTTLSANWTDLSGGNVTSVFGRTGAVVATEGDYSLNLLSDTTIATPTTNQLLRYNGTSWVNWTANYLTTNQTITLSGDITGSGTTAITTALANSGVVAGTYQSATTITPLTIDAKGRVTSVGAATTIAPAFSSITSKPTTINGYGITDGVTLTGTETLTNKTFTDNTTFFQDNLDNTKKAQFDLSSIATTTTRTYALPNDNGKIVITNSGNTQNIIPKFNNDDKLIASNIIDDGSFVTVGPFAVFDIAGTTSISYLSSFAIGVYPIIGLNTGNFTEANFYGAINEPSLFSNDATSQSVIVVNPKIPYCVNGTNNYTGSKTGANITFASNTTATNNWDVGVGANAVGVDTFSIGRNGTSLFTMSNAGAITTNINTTAQITTTQANNTGTGLGQIYLNGATGNRIDFNVDGAAAPTFTTRSVGTKIVLQPQLSGTAMDYAIGVEGSGIWLSVQDTTNFFRFYAGVTVISRIGNNGIQTRGQLYEGNAAFTVLNTTSTLTIAQILTLVIESTPTANITFTLPTGTNTDAGVMSSLETFASFTWSIVNRATGFTITMAGNTGNTYIGNTTIAANTSASFRTQKTAANTFKTVRI